MLKSIQERLEALPETLRTVTAEEARKELAENKGALIDVREPSELADSPVPASYTIPRGVLEMKALDQFKNPDKPLYLHCASGVRARLAGEQLIAMGYTNVTALISDIKDIQKAFNP
ncbi:rhodanese-like domain-containing protein [Salinimonas chungwhensis]|uniref:rhodanese-like domain-containing protein n=1 Tax=Salinimonas chungwhensis TaxID=265425 RepID=UPI000381A10E|nr:rhodanese-like domain-containing protein [Salinimonas chungwhensis]